MRKEIFEVVEAARDLGVRIASDAKNGFTLEGEIADFPRRLVDLAQALERLDASGAEAAEASADDYKLALSKVLHWMRSQGISLDDPVKFAISGLVGDDFDDVLSGEDPNEAIRTLIEPLVLRPQPGDYGPEDRDEREKLEAKLDQPQEFGDLTTAEELEERIQHAGTALTLARNAARSVRSRAATATDLDDEVRAALLLRATIIAKSAEHALEEVPSPAPRPTPHGSDLENKPDKGHPSEYDVAINAMMDKLDFAATKIGVSPKLRALAISWRNAQARAKREARLANGRYVLIPEADWAKVGKAVTEVSLDQKVAQPLPALRPKAPAPRPEPEAEGPRPPVLRPRF